MARRNKIYYEAKEATLNYPCLSKFSTGCLVEMYCVNSLLVKTTLYEMQHYICPIPSQLAQKYFPSIRQLDLNPSHNFSF